MNKTSLRIVLAATALAALGACAHRDGGPTATASLTPTTGNAGPRLACAVIARS